MMTEQDMELARLQAENNRLRHFVAELVKDGLDIDNPESDLPCWTGKIFDNSTDPHVLLFDLSIDDAETREVAQRNLREHDLVRAMRCELFTEHLITQEEYTALASEHGAVQRLEDYDALRAKLTALEQRKP